MHEPVLLKEAIELLHIKSQDWYIDATLGAGGHTIEILKLGGNVVGIDQDPAMLKIAQVNIEEAMSACPVPKSNFGEFKLLHGNFVNIDDLAKQSGISSFKGILLDLGVSNVHYTDKSRGFSFSDPNAPLDMRLDKDTQGVKASDLLNVLRQEQLHALFETSMDYKSARSLAQKVVGKRKFGLFQKMADFLNLFNHKVGATHPATQGLMALRIAVNSELDNIKIALPKALNLLEADGRLAVITFHSTEDKLVKHIFQDFINENKVLLASKESIVPSLDELARNKKARSARLRGVVKI